MNKRSLISKNNAFILGGILIACLIAGSFCDYQLSQAVFNKENLFGNILAAYGQLPTSAALSVAGVLLIYSADHRKQSSLLLSYAGGIVLNLFALFMGVMEPTMYFPDTSIIMLVLITVLLFVLINAILLHFVKDATQKDIRNYVKFILFVVFAQVIIINIIKIPWGRPRMRMIAETPGASFQSWWIIGSEMKDTLMAMGVASEEFKSFPSGHTASAACMLLICALPMLSDQLKQKGTILFWGAVIVTALVAFSRIIMGAHFLTDVTVGFTITFLIILLGSRIFYSSKRN